MRKKIICLVIVITLFSVTFVTSFANGDIVKFNTGIKKQGGFKASPLNGQWKNIGLKGMWVTSLSVSSKYIYAGTRANGVFRKELNKANSPWEYLGFENIEIRWVHVDQTNLSTVYVGLVVFGIINESGEPHSIYKSTDEGETWNPCDNGIIENAPGEEYRLPVFCVKSMPDNPDILFATSWFHIFKSVNGGKNWSLIFGGYLGMGLHIISFDPNNPQNIWIGGEATTFRLTVLKSVNSGENWTDVSPTMSGDNACYSIAVSPSDSDTIYMGIEGGVMKTINGGKTWSIIFKPSDYPYIYGLEIDPSNPHVIYAGGTKNAEKYPLTVWISKDAGISWHLTKVEIENGGARVHSITLDTNNHKILYAGTENGVWEYKQIM